jgi:hypothetical protein
MDPVAADNNIYLFDAGAVKEWGGLDEGEGD